MATNMTLAESESVTRGSNRVSCGVCKWFELCGFTFGPPPPAQTRVEVGPEHALGPLKAAQERPRSVHQRRQTEEGGDEDVEAQVRCARRGDDLEAKVAGPRGPGLQPHDLDVHVVPPRSLDGHDEPRYVNRKAQTVK